MDVESVPFFIEEGRDRNKCLNETKVTYQQGNASCITYLGCEAEVSLCTINGMGHTWPGRQTYSPKTCERNPDGILCKAWVDNIGALNQDINANQEIWAFFMKHTLNESIA
ncbi:MAG: hypothetical protein B6U97_01615 [Candidatus Altiarchaeales archaeon ex4484_96]|nr:MAG: hypothetical protein B6U97_01615 [Candidatus Altiarchaeales archaeon ex4484_96]